MSERPGFFYAGEAQDQSQRRADRQQARVRLVALNDEAKAGLLVELAERLPRLLLELTRELPRNARLNGSDVEGLLQACRVQLERSPRHLDQPDNFGAIALRAVDAAILALEGRALDRAERGVV